MEQQILDDQKKTDSEKCFSVWAWIIQYLVWGSWALLIVGCAVEGSLITVGGVLVGITTFAYIVTMCCSPTFKYLSNLHKGAGIHQKMGELFKTPPRISFHATCYHYETHHYTTTDSNGRTQHHTEQRRVDTHYANEEFEYYSVKDVSGLFLLNMSSAYNKKKAFIKLHLHKEINFADAISYADYIRQKEAFWRENRYRDTHMDFSENREIPGFESYNLVQIGDYYPPCFSVWIYCFFILIPFVQIYKSYIDSCCIRQNYTIRKIVSTRYNLLSVQYEQQFASLQPSLNLQSQMYSFDASQTGVIIESHHPPLPSQEELSQAQQYNSYVPHYETSSENGVVQDCNNIMNVNYNMPPPCFENMAGSVALSSDQLAQQPMVQQQQPLYPQQQQPLYPQQNQQYEYSNQMQGNMMPNPNMNVNMNANITNHININANAYNSQPQEDLNTNLIPKPE